MTISRRDAIALSGSAIVGLSVGGLDPKELAAQVAGQEQEFPDRLIDVEPRATFPVDLPLNPDGWRSDYLLSFFLLRWALLCS